MLQTVSTTGIAIRGPADCNQATGQSQSGDQAIAIGRPGDRNRAVGASFPPFQSSTTTRGTPDILAAAETASGLLVEFKNVVL